MLTTVQQKQLIHIFVTSGLPFEEGLACLRDGLSLRLHGDEQAVQVHQSRAAEKRKALFELSRMENLSAPAIPGDELTRRGELVPRRGRPRKALPAPESSAAPVRARARRKPRRSGWEDMTAEQRQQEMKRRLNLGRRRKMAAAAAATGGQL